MSGRGVKSVRLPRSLLKKRRAESSERGKTLHNEIRAVVCRIEHFDVSQLRGLPNPPHEPNPVRLSLYLGPEGVNRLNAAARKSGLTSSTLLLRLLYALPEIRRIKFVQPVVKEKQASPSSWRTSLILGALFLLPLITAVLGFPLPVNLQGNSTRTYS